MRGQQIRLILIMFTTVAIFAVAVVPVATAGRSKITKIIDLGAVLQGSDGGALGINEHGEVVGAVVALNGTHEAFRQVDVLVNCLGGSQGGSFLETDDAAWRASLDANVFPSIRASRAAIPLMQAQGGGAIVMICSIFGRESRPLPAQSPSYNLAYDVSKMAEIALAKTMARDLAPAGGTAMAHGPSQLIQAVPADGDEEGIIP